VLFCPDYLTKECLEILLTSHKEKVSKHTHDPTWWQKLVPDLFLLSAVILACSPKENFTF